MLPQTRLGRITAGLVLALVASTLTLSASTASTASTVRTTGYDPAANPITPGNVTGRAFDQCEAPSQAAMTAWRKSSPFRSVGIYMSGSLRYCQAQTNLTPTWVRTQLAAGWKLLPIHLGAQASCTTRERFLKNRISAAPANNYAVARGQGTREANVAVAAARRLGLVTSTVLYYDLEAFPMTSAGCKDAALKFLSAWTRRVHTLGYLSGVYSSAASGIKLLDDARVYPGNTNALPDQIWIADWNGKATTASAYIRSDGWPGRRIHQYRGGHVETWGGVAINIDRSYLDLRGQPATTPRSQSVHDPACRQARVSRRDYRYTSPTTRTDLHVALQCLLKQVRLFSGPVTGRWDARTTTSVGAWQRMVHHPVRPGFTRADWTAILVANNARSVLRPGVHGADVVRVQRALNAAGPFRLAVNSQYDAATRRAVGIYQRRLGLKQTRNVTSPTWISLEAGRM